MANCIKLMYGCCCCCCCCVIVIVQLCFALAEELTGEELRSFKRALLNDPSTSTGDRITAINEGL